MHVQYVALCDQVIIGADGRPSLINVFSDMQVPALPTGLPRLAFAARLLFTADELGQNKRVEVVITDPAGNELGRPGGELALPAPPPGTDSVAIDLPLQLDMFEVTTAGRYSFILHFDGKPVAAAQLAVRQVMAH